MIDVIRNPHMPLYDRGRPQGGVSPSLYWGVGLAVLLHLLLAWCLIHQTFSGPAPEPATPPPSIGVTFEELSPPPPPQKPHAVVPRISPHVTPLSPPPTAATTPLAPVKTAPLSGPAQTPVIDNSPQQATSASASSAPAYVTPRWTRFPDGAALASYYPPRALDNEVEGSSLVECTVLDVKGRVACVAVSETPKGYGFGAATARMVQDRGRVDLSQGDVRVGAKLRTTVKWTLG